MRIKVDVEQRNCGNCGKEFKPRIYTQNTCSKKCWGKLYDKTPKGLEVKRYANLRYKDKVRHAHKRRELVDENGYVCSECGRSGSSFEIVAHHSTFDSDSHEHQELLCRACHARVHHSGERSASYKKVSKEDIEEAFGMFNKLEQVCEHLSISRSALYKKRKQYGLPSRTDMRGFNNPDVKTNNSGTDSTPLSIST